MSEAGIFDAPIARTLPLRTRLVSADSVSSISVSGIGAVDLIEVDVVGPQAAQRVLHRRDDPPPGGTLVVRVVPMAAELRREDDVVTAAFKGLADDLLGVSVRVSGVDEVDAGVQRLVDDPDGILGWSCPCVANMRAPRP